MTYVDEHTVTVDATPDETWRVVSTLGGDERFYTPLLLWRARGRVDRLLGGPGHRIEGPGRPLRVGDAMDFWEVVEVRSPTRLRARALTRLPGTAYLDIAVRPLGSRTELTVRTDFEPAGVVGHGYWWSNLAAHKVTFELMTRRLATMVAGLDSAPSRTKVN
jgi:Protein of unknown function (DUF2867)/Polyketide cyclase / dehydrase and lipid transport